MGKVEEIRQKWAKSRGVNLSQKTVDRNGEWALVRIKVLENVHRKNGMCACVPTQRCPCDEMINEHYCECRLYFMPDEMDNVYAKKDSIKLTRTEDKFIIEIPKKN